MIASLVRPSAGVARLIQSTPVAPLRTIGDNDGEVVPVDAYSSYIKHISDARLGVLRREAADYALSASARRRRRARWAQVLRRLVQGRVPAPVAPPLPQPRPQTLSRSNASSR
jgi:hypothetical protein